MVVPQCVKDVVRFVAAILVSVPSTRCFVVLSNAP